MDGIELVDDADEVETEWVRISECMDAEGDMAIRIHHSEGMVPWKMLGMLQAAADFHRTMMTNEFFAYSCEYCEEGGDDE